MEENEEIKTEPKGFTLGNANAFSSSTPVKNIKDCDFDNMDFVVVTIGDIVNFQGK